MVGNLRNLFLKGAMYCLSVTFFAVAALALAQGQPQEGRLQKEPESEESSLPKISVKLQLMRDAPDNKSLRSVSSSTGYKGTLVYGDFVALPSANGNSWRPFLKRAVTGSTAQPHRISAFLVSGVNDKAFDPQFSPDGKTVMFKVGSVGHRHSYHRLCFWDLATNQVQVGPGKLNYLFVYWSPNSKYVAYIKGGDIEGNEAPRDPLSLYIYDVKAQKSRFIAKNPMVKQMVWTAQNTLLYNVKQKQQESANAKPRAYLADIYMVPAGKGDPTLLLQNAFAPQPSPNGKKVAFFAWPEEGESETGEVKAIGQAQLGLYVYDYEQKKRTPLRSAFSYLKFVGMRWMPNNRSLITLQELEESPNAKAQLAVIDTSVPTSKNLMVLQAKDFQAVGSRIETQPQFKLLEVPNNGKVLFVETSEFVGWDSSLLIEEKSIQAVNLDTGKVDIVAKVRSSLGMNWRSDNVKPAAPAKE